jgi:hypothetical protein
MVNDDPASLFETPYPRSFFHHLSAGFMSGDDPLVTLGTFAHMFPVNGPDIATTNGRRFHPYQHLSVSRFGNRQVFKNDRTVTGEISPLHCSFHSCNPPPKIGNSSIKNRNSDI